MRDKAEPRLRRPGIPAQAVARAGLIPLSIATCFVLYYVAHVPFGGVVLASLPFLLLFTIAPRWAKASTASFDRDVLGLLAQKKFDALRARYGRAVGMRGFGPPALAAERRGMVALESGDAQGARSAYQKAIDGYDDGDPPVAVELGFAHACFALGEDEDAIRVYRHVLARAGSLPNVQKNLDTALARSRKTAASA